MTKFRLNPLPETLLDAAVAPTVARRGWDVVDPMPTVVRNVIRGEISTAPMGQSDDAVMGLPFDAQIVRSRKTSSIAALMGTWFWWPTDERPRGAPKSWPKVAQETTA
ncbi:hypothetical protein [Mycolicibacterium litorale]|uniref:Uncharacterized protein n=1 Tax=Mycolicibacterium litorale TaxID=758802 RepID=A0AAD1IM56_9MYCO|nr:hypothetical protein [Mycolicibacterium litorale]MCV7415772.1 hypothetical protein [Mycolicibacterium litorale]BBY16958.1 hypothetical protein MLIT_25500 [Mycolicibacterium litorale]